MTVSSATNSSSAATSSASTSSSSSSSNTGGSTSLSSIDWNALIQAGVQAKLQAATSIQTTITANQAKITAYQKMQTLLSDLQTAAEPFSTSNTSSLATSAFSARSAAITATGSVDPSSAVAMTVDNGAPSGTYTLTISQVAQPQKVTGTVVASQSSDLGYTGTFSIGLSGGSSVNIAVNTNMSLQDLVSAINAQETTTNVQASVIQVSSSQFELVLSATQDGADIATSSVSGDDVLTNLGVTDGSGNFTNEVEKAQSAIISLDGITITRNTNDISDVISNTTIHLYQPTPSGSSLNITISPDTSQISTALQTLVTDYNAYRDYVTSQQQTAGDGTAASGTVLFGDPTMNDIMNQLENAMNTTVNGLSLSDLGLSFNGSNDLELDTTTLQTALTDNLPGVEALLASQAVPSSTDLSTIATNGTAPSQFTLDVTVDGSGNLTSASIGGDMSLFTVSGNAIIGNAGTPYSGMAFDYTGSTSQSIVVTTTSGIASLLSSIANTASDPSTGTLQTLVSNLQTEDTSLTQRVSDIESDASQYQSQLQTQYAQYQAAIQAAQNTLTYLTALLNSKSSSN
ncbi:flagellar filament capping protein FliD [Rhodoplanes sp. Z2-YC6860]|uniref:flagellar filament capping protein FliD n=1 Tax=Rhodoplanes sp. Z2-YC6860 TaxID=674703 RepID=UPI00078C79FA|nr:flagellar filament capping protein FliD [Rhodoplanes sp. Z2-YC6860]AMN39087.1 flagellar hook-associated protein FliD [Rhodoplanes sp. Z2-YC6860]